MQKKQLVITPSHFFQFDIQPLWIWYDRFGDQSKKEEISDFALKIMEDGILHEENILADLQVMKVKSQEPEQALKETLDLMYKGEPLIYQGWIEAEIEGVILRGRPDLLEKRYGESKLGQCFYVPVDIKSSSKIKASQRDQIIRPLAVRLRKRSILYAWILEALQRALPRSAEIITGGA